MDFAFSEEQELLRASVREVMQDRYPADRVAALADDGFPTEEWAAVAELGWTAVSVPEAEGGAGLGFLEEIVVAEELGRAVYPGPFLPCVVMALPLLRTAGADDLAKAVIAGERIATVAWSGSDGRFDERPPAVEAHGDALTGTRSFVPHLAVADLVVVAGTAGGEAAFWTVDPQGQGASRRQLPTVDGTRPLGELRMEDAPAERLAVPPEAARGVRRRALAALAAEAVGVAARALDLALEHVRTREQFGRPIGAFQAVSHPLVDAFMEIETARSLAYWAGWAVAEDVPEAGAAAAAAKVRAADVAVAACERAIQAHGGIGFTWEHFLHRCYRRALGISHLFGGASSLRREVAAWLADRT